jgi:excisionase family DNA binding protein
MTPAAGSPDQTTIRLYTLEQVSEMTGWSLSHLRRALKSGHLRHHKLGRSIRISHADYLAFLELTHQPQRATKNSTKSGGRNGIRRTP